MTPAIDKNDGRGLINIAGRERLLIDAVIATEGLPKRQSASVIKVSGLMRSGTFKRPAFSFTVIISA